MDITEQLKSQLKIIINSTINEETFKKLCENSYSSLINNQEMHNISSLYNSKPDLIKDLYGTLLTVIAECGRNDITADNIKILLTKEGCNSKKSAIFIDLYKKYKVDLQNILGSISSYLPHIVDVQWKIDYLIKSSTLDQSDGPFFRITLVTKVFDECTDSPQFRNVNFICNSKELQDLIYKLKESVRHCQSIALE